MSSLIKKQITDKNGVATSRWVRPDTSGSNVERVSGLSTKPNPLAIMLGGAVVPELSFDKLYHVGHLDQSMKKQWSLEGSGLSVSQNPAAWMKIAQLAGDTHELDVPDNRFLDWYELTTEQRDAINQWGVDRGYLAPAQLYRVTYWDDELEYEVVMVCETLEEATEEADMHGTEPEPYDGLVATDAFPERSFMGGATNYDQVIAAAWVNEAAPEFDGVWWADDLDTSRDSAPRGVLATGKIAEWIDSSRVISESEMPDEDDYEDYDYEDEYDE